MDENNWIWLFIKQFYIFLLILILILLKIIKIYQFIIGYIFFCIYHQIFTYTKIYYSKNSKIILEIIKECPSITALDYKPPFFFPINPLQLINLNRTMKKPKYKISIIREYIKNNGESLDWIKYENISIENKPILIIFPGLTGSVNDPYVFNIVNEGILNGFNVGIYQMRILNDTFKHLEKPYLCLMDDIDDTLDHIRKKFGEKIKIYAIGYSYGANQLVKYLGLKNCITKKIFAAVSISNPFEFLICEKFLTKTIYNRMLLIFLQNSFKKTRKAFEKYEIYKKNCDKIANTTEMRDYDKYLTIKLFGFETVTDYYREVGCAIQLKNLNIPLLCINALDDQITNAKAIPYDYIENNKNIILLTPSLGSHSCFLMNDGFFGVKQWIIKPEIEFIKACDKLNDILNKFD